VKLAFESLKVKAEISSDPEKILSAERVVFPGVGAAGTAMKTLDQLKLAEVIRAVVKQGTPFLGICLGTQIIFDRSEEDGGTKCIGLIPGLVRLFKPVERFDKVPQIGWNNVSLRRQHPVMEGIGNDSYFYFVHSYYPAPTDKECVLGETTYANTTFASIIAQENLIATQFHPEKSGRVGLQLLGNFLNWKP
jgi:glutamine amidotransferase